MDAGHRAWRGELREHEADSSEPRVLVSLRSQGAGPASVLPYLLRWQWCSESVPPHLRYKAGRVQPFLPSAACPAETQSTLSGRREKTVPDATTPEEKPARVPHPTSQQSASGWNQWKTSCAADEVLATRLLLLKEDKKKALTLQLGPKRSRPRRSGSLGRGEQRCRSQGLLRVLGRCITAACCSVPRVPLLP